MSVRGIVAQPCIKYCNNSKIVLLNEIANSLSST